MPDLESIVRALQRPTAYDHAVCEPIGHIQTHISHVLLTGDFAYKVKKPVDLGFLDYSTLKRRRYFCEREVELNRQFAPTLYLKSVPIYETSSGYSFVRLDESDPVVEYAVKMRQFSEDDVLLRIFERGGLVREDMFELAQALADAHRGAHTSSAVAAFGAPAAIREMAQANIDQMRPYVGRTISVETFAQLERGQKTYCETHADLLNGRVRSGMIRECHGDLHLNNICRYEGRFQFFDRIEFNDAFKNIDVMYDTAFLLMDLRFRGSPHLAITMLNHYLELTGDYEGASLLPFYLSMRALIRGEVQSILSGEPEVEDTERERAALEASRYFDHAVNALKRTRGFLVLVGGVSGSGKSFLATRLAPTLEAIHIRSDAVRKHLAGVPLDEHHHAVYSEEHTRATYDELERLGYLLCAGGQAVILDATFLDSIRRKRVLRRARKNGTPTAIIFCTSTPAELERRIRKRQGDVSDATVDVMLEQLKVRELPSDTEADAVHIVRETDTLNCISVLSETLGALTR